MTCTYSSDRVCTSLTSYSMKKYIGNVRLCSFYLMTPPINVGFFFNFAKKNLVHKTLQKCCLETSRWYLRKFILF